MELELTPDESSLVTGILTVWVTKMVTTKYEKMLVMSVLNKIFAEDKIVVDKMLRPLEETAK